MRDARVEAIVARENAAVKARRYVAEGRLTVELVADGEVRARCRGDGAIYRLTYEDGRWSCTCPALGRCSHLMALGLVVVAEGRGGGWPR
jgi:uncharacterized Zn finger protein